MQYTVIATYGLRTNVATTINAADLVAAIRFAAQRYKRADIVSVEAPNRAQGSALVSPRTLSAATLAVGAL